MSKINETLKQRIDEFDIDRRVNEFTAQAESAWRQLADNATGLARDHREEVDRALDKLTAAIDERTDGRYADQAGRATDQVRRGVAKLAERQPGDSEGTTGGPTA